MAHVFSQMPFGTVALREGVALAGADLFELTVESGGGHAALAHETRDAVFAAAQLVSALQSITAREISPRDFLVLGVASIAGGEAANVVTNEITLRGTVRWLDTTVRERALARMDEIAAGVCGALRVAYRLDVTATIPVMRCAPEPIATLASAASTAGANVIDPGIVPVSEDFANVAERLPAALIGIGEGCGAHHAPDFDFDLDERAIGVTAEVLTRPALARLRHS